MSMCICPNSPRSQASFAVVIRSLGRPEEAVRLFDELNFTKFENQRLQGLVIEGLVRNGDLDRAKLLLRTPPDDVNLRIDLEFQLVKAYSHQRGFREAIACFNCWGNDHPQNIWEDKALIPMASCIASHAKESLDELIACLKDLLAKHPEMWPLKEVLADAWSKKGETDKAIACLKDLVDKVPEDSY